MELPELDELMQSHDLDDVKITVSGDGYVRVFTLDPKVIPMLTSAGYDVWMYAGSEFLDGVEKKEKHYGC